MPRSRFGQYPWHFDREDKNMITVSCQGQAPNVAMNASKLIRFMIEHQIQERLPKCISVLQRAPRCCEMPKAYVTRGCPQVLTSLQSGLVQSNWAQTWPLCKVEVMWILGRDLLVSEVHHFWDIVTVTSVPWWEVESWCPKCFSPPITGS